MRGFRKKWLTPVSVTLIALLLYMGVNLVLADFDPYTFVRIGSTFSEENAVDETGYDGQFVYFIARDPDPARVTPLLDVPAYRYQRVLLPMLARLLSFGNPDVLPWMLAFIGIAAHTAGVWVVDKLLVMRAVSRWYSLVYGLWAGFLLAARLDLPEPLAFLLVAGGILAGETRPWLKWSLFGLAVFAKEVVLLFVLGQILVYLLQQNWRYTAGLIGTAIVPYAGFQLWLMDVFGAPGIGSGGAMATSFEWVPFMGWFRIIPFSPTFFVLYGLIVVPFFYFPSIWSIMKTVRRPLQRMVPGAAYLLVNAVAIPFLPFSTVREPGGLFRFGCGLILAFLLFTAETGEKKALRYSFVWLALSTVVLNA